MAPSVTRRRRWVANAGLTAVAAVVALALAEGVLRLFPGFLPEEARLRLHWRDLEGEVPTVGHAYAGFHYRPGALVQEQGGEVQWSFVADEHGFRNPDPWPDSADVVLVGDSEALGYGMDDERAWPRVVARAIAPRGLINLAVAGAGPEQSARLFATFGEGLHPKLLLFGVFPGNDFSDAVQFQQWLDGGATGSFADWRAGRSSSAGPLPRLLGTSYVATVAGLALRGGLASARGVTLDLGEDGSLVLVPSFVERESRLARPGTEAFDLVVSAIARAQAEAGRAGVRMLVLLFPTKEEVYMPSRGLDVPDLIGPLAAELEARGILSIDLTPSFAAVADSGPPLFYRVDGHPNAAGNAVIARVVLDALRSERLAGTEAPPRP